MDNNTSSMDKNDIYENHILNCGHEIKWSYDPMMLVQRSIKPTEL